MWFVVIIRLCSVVISCVYFKPSMQSRYNHFDDSCAYYIWMDTLRKFIKIMRSTYRYCFSKWLHTQIIAYVRMYTDAPQNQNMCYIHMHISEVGMVYYCIKGFILWCNVRTTNKNRCTNGSHRKLICLFYISMYKWQNIYSLVYLVYC